MCHMINISTKKQELITQASEPPGVHLSLFEMASQTETKEIWSNLLILLFWKEAEFKINIQKIVLQTFEIKTRHYQEAILMNGACQ